VIWDASLLSVKGSLCHFKCQETISEVNSFQTLAWFSTTLLCRLCISVLQLVTTQGSCCYTLPPRSPLGQKHSHLKPSLLIPVTTKSYSYVHASHSSPSMTLLYCASLQPKKSLKPSYLPSWLWIPSRICTAYPRWTTGTVNSLPNWRRQKWLAKLPELLLHSRIEIPLKLSSGSTQLLGNPLDHWLIWTFSLRKNQSRRSLSQWLCPFHWEFRRLATHLEKKRISGFLLQQSLWK